PASARTSRRPTCSSVCSGARSNAKGRPPLRSRRRSTGPSKRNAGCSLRGSMGVSAPVAQQREHRDVFDSELISPDPQEVVGPDLEYVEILGRHDLAMPYAL